MNTSWLEAMGFLASFIVLISLLMSSIIKLRWINLLGSAVFATYGFLIGSLPVGVMNICTCLINIHYLLKIYRSKEYFQLLPLEGSTAYFNYFIDFYKEDIHQYYPFNPNGKPQFDVAFYILRNAVPAGIFIASQEDETTLKIDLDFVTPEYRDFKVGTYIYEKNQQYFLNQGYHRLVSYATNPKHGAYLEKMGFEKTVLNGTPCYLKRLA